MELFGVKFVVLWTDALVYVLVASITMFVFYARHHEHLRAPWRQVLRRRLAMSAFLVLSAYIVIGLLDSIHFRLPLENSAAVETQTGDVRYASRITSLFDQLVGSLGEAQERTYSAPFAIEAYAKESVELEDGSKQRIFPRLLFAGTHLSDANEHASDLAQIGGISLARGAGAWLMIIAMLFVVLAWKQKRNIALVATSIMRGEGELPWRSVLLTLLVLCVLVSGFIHYSSAYHVFGTDKVGQDILYQTLKSVRTGLVIGTLTTLIMLPFAIMLGIMAGYFRGWVDDVIQYIYTTLSSIPDVLLIVAVMLMLDVYLDRQTDLNTLLERADLRLLLLCAVMGITSWTGLCRLLRGEALKLREVDYIQAAQSFGVRHLKIITRHILPNVMHIVLISVVLGFSGLVLAEAVLSYIGVGVDPSMHSWGNMINSARLEMAREPIVWWPLLAAFMFMFMLVLAANLFADAVRDAFDPRLRKR